MYNHIQNKVQSKNSLYSVFFHLMNRAEFSSDGKRSEDILIQYLLDESKKDFKQMQLILFYVKYGMDIFS